MKIWTLIDATNGKRHTLFIFLNTILLHSRVRYRCAARTGGEEAQNLFSTKISVFAYPISFCASRHVRLAAIQTPSCPNTFGLSRHILAQLPPDPICPNKYDGNATDAAI
jgi:hypothetical protein